MSSFKLFVIQKRGMSNDKILHNTGECNYKNIYPLFVVQLDSIHQDEKSYHTTVSVNIVTILESLISDQVGIG